MLFNMEYKDRTDICSFRIILHRMKNFWISTGLCGVFYYYYGFQQRLREFSWLFFRFLSAFPHEFHLNNSQLFTHTNTSQPQVKWKEWIRKYNFMRETEHYFIASRKSAESAHRWIWKSGTKNQEAFVCNKENGCVWRSFSDAVVV